MNNRDPFGLRNAPALGILRATASRAAADIQQRAIEAGTNAIELGKQAVEDMSFNVPKQIPSFSNAQQRLAEDNLWAAATGRPTPQPQQRHHDRGPGGVGGLLDNVREGAAGLLGQDSRTLPMYKDKPYAYPPSGRRQPFWKRKSSLFLVFVVFVVYFLFFSSSLDNHKERVKTGIQKNLKWLQEQDARSRSKANWEERRKMVVEAFELSWDSYERHAWGYDEYHPETKKGRQMAPKGLGWIIIDALDTMMIMNQTSRLVHAREWISKSLTWDQEQDVNTFETTIRMMGGLLSAHYLSTTFPDMAPIKDDDVGQKGEDLYLETAKDLADRLLSAFESPSGIPYASVDLGKQTGIPSHDTMGASSTAEATTLQLEFKYLAKLTGEKLYWDKVEKVMQIVDDNNEYDGLVPIYIEPATGAFYGQNIRLGSRGDSYYEYLIKQYLQTNKAEKVYSDMWHESLAGVRKHLITYTKHTHLTVLGERPSGLSGQLEPKMDHLVCFMPGTIALAATGGLTEKEARKLSTWTKQHDEDMRLARELMTTCWGMYKYMATGLAAEITYFEIDNPALPESAPHADAPKVLDTQANAPWRADYDVHAMDKHNLQRPETVESLVYMWRITGEEKYREWGWEMFQSFMEHTAVKDNGGFTSLSDANQVPPVTRDNMESFWLAETLKYFYLLFSPNDLLPLDKIVFNTEAHPFPRFDMGKLFSTGWERKPRGKDGKVIKPEETN